MRRSLRVTRAREQRQIMSDSERRLWYHLRDRRFLAYKFRRQVPIGPFIADFACKSARLIIETDGESHGYDDQELRDFRRTLWLYQNGWRVLRKDRLQVIVHEHPEVLLEFVKNLSQRLRQMDARLERTSPLPPAGEGQGEGPSRLYHRLRA